MTTMPPMPEERGEGGRVFFARSRRAPDRDTEIRLVSVGVDIGSSTSHLAFSRLVLRRRAGRSQVVRRELLHESEIFLTPYVDSETIDTDALGRFIGRQYDKADIDPEMIDTGALILTGVAARQGNARAVGELFASETGRFVAVTAGDALETALAAHGSGAAAASAREDVTVMNIDIGGGTSKIAICRGGSVGDLTALDVGARLVCFDSGGRVARIEPAGLVFAKACGVVLELGAVPEDGALKLLTSLMAERLFEACGGIPLSAMALGLLRLAPLAGGMLPDQVSFSGGVAEYIHGRERQDFGDLGKLLADAILVRFRGWGPQIRFADQGIRATVIGASQHSVQLSGNTIFVDPEAILPLANLPVIVPEVAFDADELDVGVVADAVRAALRRLDLGAGQLVAVGYRWVGPATFARLDAFAAGLARGLAPLLAAGMPLVLVGDGDVGGLLGVHCRAERVLAKAVVSIDGVLVRELDFIDIGEVLQVSGGVPVVVKSLVFPSEA